MKTLQRDLTETLVNRENYLFNYYYQQEGLQELIDSLQNYLEKSAIYAKKEDILVTSGTQQALYILSQVPFPNHKKTILLEQPTYHRMNDLVASLKLPYQTIERDFEGIDLARLEELFKTGDIKFFYSISRFSNPLGLSYSTSEKQKIVKLAECYDVYIIEDDYDSEFRYASRPIPALGEPGSDRPCRVRQHLCEKPCPRTAHRPIWCCQMR
mgnify:CR=1 FL=1